MFNRWLALCSFVILLILSILLPTLSFAFPTVQKSETFPYDFTFRPISLLVGVASADILVRTSETWAIGPTLGSGSFSVGSWSFRVIDVGGVGVWAPHGIFRDGLYLSPRIEYIAVTGGYTDSVFGNGNASVSLVGVKGLIGYGWFWDSFNIQLGGGLATTLGATTFNLTTNTGNQQTTTYPNATSVLIDFSLGWLF